MSINPITVTYDGAKQRSGLGITTLTKLVREGRVKSVKIDGRRLIVLASLDALLTSEPEAAA